MTADQRLHRYGSGLLAVLVLLLLALSGGAAAGSGVQQVALGVATSGVNTSSSDPASALASFAKEVGSEPRVAMWYQTWYAGWAHKLVFPTVMAACQQAGVVPEITWMPYTASDNSTAASYADIAAGKQDAYLHAAAAEAKAWGHPFFLRPFHEMNGRWSRWQVGSSVADSPADFVAAWRHLVLLFRNDGATNVKWIFSPNVISSASPDFSGYYPGDTYVDWVGLDGYNWGTAKAGFSWRSFTQIFQQTYGKVVSLSQRPIMVAETASTELGGNKAAWIKSTYLTEIPTKFPRIRAVTWFDFDKETDWRVNSSQAALKAYRQIVAASQNQLSVLGLLAL